MQLKKSKSWEPFRSFQLNSTADLAQFWGKWAGLAVLFILQLQNVSQDFHCPWCRILNLCEIHCYLCPNIFWVYYFSHSQCEHCAFIHKWCSILGGYPTHLKSDFYPIESDGYALKKIILDPPTSPKIRHHICTFQKTKIRYETRLLFHYQMHTIRFWHQSFSVASRQSFSFFSKI